MANVDSVLECPICRDILVIPKALPCQHIYCLRCLEKYGESREDGGVIACPVCKQEFPLPSGGVQCFQKSFIVDTLLEIRKSCDRCEDHPGRYVEAFCECRTPTCIQCHMVGQKHADHMFKDIGEVAKTATKDLNESAERILKKSCDASAALDDLDEKLKVVSDALLAVEGQVIRARDEVKSAVERHADRLLRKLDAIREEKVAEHEVLRQRFQRHLEQLEDYRKTVRETIDHASSNGLMRSCDQLLATEEVLSGTDAKEWQNEFRLVEFVLVPAHLHPYIHNRSSLIGRLMVVPEESEGSPISLLSPAVVGEFHCRGRAYGVTFLDGSIYVVLDHPIWNIDVYDLESMSLKTSFKVPDLLNPRDLVSCEINKCLYISDYSTNRVVHRVQLPKIVTSNWQMNDFPSGLSVTLETNILVSCPASNKLVEFTTRGLKVREISLPEHVKYPLHAIQLETGHLVVTHGKVGSAVHAVTKLDPEGHQVIVTFGGTPGTTIGRLNNPNRVAVDGAERLFVCDHFNDRIQVLSSTLQSTGKVVGNLQNPSSCVVHGDSLFVVESCASGRLVVVNLGGGSGRESISCSQSRSVESGVSQNQSVVSTSMRRGSVSGDLVIPGIITSCWSTDYAGRTPNK